MVKLQAHQGALKAEIMKSITGESTFDTDLLKEMMEENKQVMIFDEDNIHAEKESERQIIDWDRTYFLTKYYSI